MEIRNVALSAAIAAALAATTVQAEEMQDQSANTNSDSNAPVEPIANWNYNQLYDSGFSAEEFLDAEVYDDEGDNIGEVEDLVVAPEGNRITGIVIETGGFADIGDTHLVYPYDQAKIKNLDSVQVAIDGENVEEFSLFATVEDDPISGGEWRISQLIDDYAYTLDGLYGWVDDVVINQSGEVLAVIVESDVTLDDEGYYAWPFYGFELGFDPEADNYVVPYSEDELAELERFNYDSFEAYPYSY